MATWQSKFIKFMFQNRHLMKGRLTRDTWDFNTSIS